MNGGAQGEEITGWHDRLSDAIARRGVRIADRVVVLAETGSTQDAARAGAGGRPGLVVVADRQASGRGRLGRAWVQREGLGVAMTVVLGAAEHTPERVSLAAGVAAAGAVAELVPGVPIGVRWPNDVVERVRGRKLAGVLVERADGLLLVGIGINVLQEPEDWTGDLRGRAASIRELGGSAARVEVAERVLVELDRALGLSAQDLGRAWAELDVLRGTRAAFLHDGRRWSGVVEGIDPASAIMLRLDDGSAVRLPALTTSMDQGTGEPPAR